MGKEITGIEGFQEQIDRRLNYMGTELLRLRADSKKDLKALRDRINKDFLWIIGILLIMWVTIILAILFKR